MPVSQGQSCKEKTNALTFLRALDTGNTFSRSSRVHAKPLAQLHTGLGDPWVPNIDLCTLSSVQMCVKTVFPGEHRYVTMKGTTLQRPGAARDQERPKSHDRISSNLSSCLPFCETRGKANASGLLGMAGSHSVPAADPAQSPALQPGVRTTAAKAAITPKTAPTDNPAAEQHPKCSCR